MQVKIGPVDMINRPTIEGDGRVAKFHHARNRPIFVLCLTLVVSSFPTGCRRDNGLPSELLNHLAQQGIAITPTRLHAPISSRGGYLIVPYSPATVTNLIARFKLTQLQPNDQQWSFATAEVGGSVSVKEIWGRNGRPPQFKLKSGGQFEYFYLLIGADGFIYLVAEYAYG